MVHPFDIETRRQSGEWTKTNWGGVDLDVIVDRARAVAVAFKEGKAKLKHVGHDRTGVRVISSDNVIHFNEDI